MKETDDSAMVSMIIERNMPIWLMSYCEKIDDEKRIGNRVDNDEIYDNIIMLLSASITDDGDDPNVQIVVESEDLMSCIA